MKSILFVFIAVMVLCCSAVMGQGSEWCGIQTVFFQHNETTTPAGYEELINYPSGNTEVIENVTLTSSMGDVLIDNYITPEGSFHNTPELLKGLRRYRTFAYVDKTTGITKLNFTVYKRNAAGNMTLFYSVKSPNIDNTAVGEILTPYVSQQDLFLDPTDRMVVRVSASTTSSAAVILSWVYQGSYHASSFESGYFVCNDINPAMAGGNLVPNELPIPVIIPITAIVVAIAAISRKKW